MKKETQKQNHESDVKQCVITTTMYQQHGDNF